MIPTRMKVKCLLSGDCRIGYNTGIGYNTTSTNATTASPDDDHDDKLIGINLPILSALREERDLRKKKTQRLSMFNNM